MKIPFPEVFADETKNGTKLKTSDYQTSGTYPIIDQGQDFIAGYTDSENGLYTDVPAIIFGDHTRVLKYVDFPFFLGADGAKILKARKAHANYRYLYYALKSVRIPDTGYNRHFKWLKEATVSIPDSQKQESIVFTLDSISRIISHRKSQLAKLDELVKCRFVEMFGNCNRIVPLKEFVWFQEGPGVRSVDFTKNGTILLTGSNINRNIITLGCKNDRFISDELANGKYSHFMCDEGDILVVSSAIDPNRFDEKVVTVPSNVRYCLNTGIIRFKPNVNYLTSEYFKAFLKTDYFKNQVKSEMRGIAQMHFGPSHLKQMTIILPDSLEHQHSFAAFVSRIDKLRIGVQAALDKAQTLFDSLMQEYFG